MVSKFTPSNATCTAYGAAAAGARRGAPLGGGLRRHGETRGEFYVLRQDRRADGASPAHAVLLREAGADPVGDCKS
jgi:hypothetical protein